MKRIIVIAFILVANTLFAQQDLFSQIKNRIEKEQPGVSLTNKLIIVNIWSSSETGTRDFNIQMNKAITTFCNAKLKGGVKGIVGVVINGTDDENMQNIVLKKDHVSLAVKISAEGLNLGGISNVVYDSNGNVVYSSLAATNVFNSIHQLITR